MFNYTIKFRILFRSYEKLGIKKSQYRIIMVSCSTFRNKVRIEKKTDGQDKEEWERREMGKGGGK